MLQRSLVVFKPDSVGRSIVGEIMSRFEKAGFTIVGLKMMLPDHDFLFHHYETIGTMMTRYGKQTFEDTVTMMMRNPVVAMVLEGVEAIETIRKLVGHTDAKLAAPGTIRGDYCHISRDYTNAKLIGLYNLVHASGNAEEAEKEIKHRFKKDELFSYDSVHKVYTR